MALNGHPVAQDSEQERSALMRILKLAYSGEMAAALAYRGHGKSVRSEEEKESLRRIEAEELCHRECLARMLAELGEKPTLGREIKMRLIGWSIGMFCRVGGWFIPMYGAGKLESGNIREYEDAALHAARSGNGKYVESLLEMAELEWDHEKYFREKTASHFLARIVPVWPKPPPKERIRASHQEKTSGNPVFYVLPRAAVTAKEGTQ